MTDRAAVPCNGCSACCRGELVMLDLTIGEDPANFLTERKETPFGPIFALQQNPDLSCVYLGPAGCTIWDRAPAMCRSCTAPQDGGGEGDIPGRQGTPSLSASSEPFQHQAVMRWPPFPSNSEIHMTQIIKSMLAAAAVAVPLLAVQPAKAEWYIVTSDDEHSCIQSPLSPAQFEQEARRRGQYVRTETVADGEMVIVYIKTPNQPEGGVIYFNSKLQCDLAVAPERASSKIRTLGK
jgi:hypothetical protein